MSESSAASEATTEVSERHFRRQRLADEVHAVEQHERILPARCDFLYFATMEF